MFYNTEAFLKQNKKNIDEQNSCYFTDKFTHFLFHYSSPLHIFFQIPSKIDFY